MGGPEEDPKRHRNKVEAEEEAPEKQPAPLESMLVTRPYERTFNVNVSRMHRHHDSPRQPKRTILEMSHMMSDLRQEDGLQVQARRISRSYHGGGVRVAQGESVRSSESVQKEDLSVRATKVQLRDSLSDARNPVESDSTSNSTVTMSSALDLFSSTTSTDNSVNVNRERLARELLRTAISKLKQVEMKYLLQNFKKKQSARKEPWKMNYPMTNLDTIPEIDTPDIEKSNSTIDSMARLPRALLPEITFTSGADTGEESTEREDDETGPAKKSHFLHRLPAIMTKEMNKAMKIPVHSSERTKKLQTMARKRKSKKRN